MIDAKRFWRHVDALSDSCEACWLWKGAKRDDGRGRFRVGRKEVRAHWAAWEIRFGAPPPRGYKLRQKCSRFDCVRHWELGNKVRKLSRVHIEAIRASTLGDRKLAKRYGVYRNAIRWHRRTVCDRYDNRGRGLSA